MVSPLEARDVPSVVYDNGFQGAATAGGEWSARAASGATVTPTISTTPVGNRQFLGQFGNSTATLSLADLPTHNAITISFDLYVINSWDGSDVLRKWGPDGWSFAIDGQSQLSTTFSNQPLASPGAANNVQSFGGQNVPAGSNPAFAGASEVNSLGYKFYRSSYQRLEAMDSVYRLEFTIPHVANAAKFDFRGFGLQGLADESWGLDNVRVVAETLPMVTVVATEHAVENGASGNFTLTRTGGDLTQPLTVSLTISGSATAGEDYEALSATTTFAAGSATATLFVTPRADNEFEDANYNNDAIDPETVIVSVMGGEGYLASGPAATVNVTDDPPVLSTSVAWSLDSQGSLFATVTLTRSGGNVAEPLTAWFEPEASLDLGNGEVLNLIFAATADFAVNEATASVQFFRDPSLLPQDHWIPLGAIGGAPLALGLRQDRSDSFLDPFLDGKSDDGLFDRFVAGLDAAPAPITFQEFLVLRAIRNGEHDSDIPIRYRDQAHKEAGRKLGATDWRTIPSNFMDGSRLVTGGTIGGAFLIAPATWPKLERNLNASIADLGSNVSAIREAASKSIDKSLRDALDRTDLTSAVLILNHLEKARRIETDPDSDVERWRRIDTIVDKYKSFESFNLYYYAKKQAAAAAAGVTVFGTPP